MPGVVDRGSVLAERVRAVRVVWVPGAGPVSGSRLPGVGALPTRPPRASVAKWAAWLGGRRSGLVRIVRRGTGSVVAWRRTQMVLLSAQNMDVAGIAKVAFTSEDHVRDVIHNFNADGFDALYPRYRGGHPTKFTLPQRREIKKSGSSRSTRSPTARPNRMTTNPRS